MGQANSRAGGAASSPAPDDNARSRRRSRSLRPASWAPASRASRGVAAVQPATLTTATLTTTAPSSSPSPGRRLSQRINPFHRARPSPPSASTSTSTATSTTAARRPQSRLTRARSSLGSLGDLLGGHGRLSIAHDTTAHTVPPLSVSRHAHTDAGPELPHVPSMAGLDLDFDRLLAASPGGRLSPASPGSRLSLASPASPASPVSPVTLTTPASPTSPARALSMLPRLRNTLGSSRRRRSLWHDDDDDDDHDHDHHHHNDNNNNNHNDNNSNNLDSIERLRRGEDQADVLSRLLSLAAAATAASLVGQDHHAATRDGTFDTFLQSLQNGSIASALRGSDGPDATDPPGAGPAPLNFFRMFRFGSSTASTTDGSEHGPGTASGNDALDGTASDNDADTDGRMVPIIIVGIRSINPASGTGHDDANIPPFLDALSSFPTPPTSAAAAAAAADTDTPLRPQNGTRFTHRRRASMGGFNFPSNYDTQRHHRTSPRDRPSLADSPPGPQPPPSTPATNIALSAYPSGSTTPTAATTPPSSAPHSSAPSRRPSFVPRSLAGPLEPTEEEEPQQPTRSPRQRRLSESDFTRYGAGAPRRRGVVEPDNNPGEGSRSWIIYVLGGSYPENHPILTTPSLFTDSPTYEDMMLLSSILGPAKAPVASEGDVAAAPGTFRILRQASALMAVEVQGDETIHLAADAQCLVCLCGFEPDEEARKLIKCDHMFHKVCIDQWLTTGRNSCPLCRGQGVDESPTPDVPTPSSPAPAEAVA